MSESARGAGRDASASRPSDAAVGRRPVPDRTARDARARAARRDRRDGAAIVSTPVRHPDARDRDADSRSRPGERRDLWFRFGRQDARAVDDPRGVCALVAARPARTGCRAPRPARRRRRRARFPGTRAMLTGGLAVDHVIGGHSLDQASTYSYVMGFNGAARDPLQHALPLVYIEPRLALSVLRNTCAWAKPDGDLPYALDGAKRPTNIIFRPSDANLWALWLAAEYAAATGDLAAFDAPLAYHPTLRDRGRAAARAPAPAVPLLRRRGRPRRARPRAHPERRLERRRDPGVRRRPAADDRARRLGAELRHGVVGAAPCSPGWRRGSASTTLAAEARAQADELRLLVAQAWNGRWFHRAYAPGRRAGRRRRLLARGAAVGDPLRRGRRVAGAVAARHDRPRAPRRLAARRAAALAGGARRCSPRASGATRPAAASGSRST